MRAKGEPVILAHIKEGVHRYGELWRRHVEYRLSEEGERLRPALQALYDWGTRRAADRGIAFEPLPIH
ncbi:winged helix-turn-helix transcriptional regulator [Amycolatopsis keratiniphila]|uniref:HxlR family transcriptional regulator n=1 Tax=Amycolatopsis keratiniphila TaxID=129921 RepID=R4SQY5_9PSEU|nr:winged helix-turn-helix transcriptional regulator [Amycolatopsis keratiniphila]AGM05015.1 HxlR family transcriptional regulator [Amycolatopsis keratiniphila]